MRRRAYRPEFCESPGRPCRENAPRLVNSVELPADLPDALYGGLVPHAGWMFSGRTAAMTLKALARRGRLDRAIVFGSDHWGVADGAAVYDRGSWATPLGDVPVDADLAGALVEAVGLLRADRGAHTREHSIEVQLPLMQALCPDVRIVPINVSPTHQAVQVGREIGELLKRDFPDVAVIGSTDLTHYGPGYGFTPGGAGPEGLEWARENDRRLLKLIQAMQAEKVIDEAASRQNACGGGAIAATVAACSALGATEGLCLEHTTSAEVMQEVYGSPAEDAVGYAAVVFA